MKLSELSPEEKRRLLAEKLQQRVGQTPSAHPLSHGQSALWFLYQLAPESVAYNIMHAVRLRFRVDVEALRRALQALIDRHDSLRTVYGVSQGKAVQRIHQHAPVPFEATDATDWSRERVNGRLLDEADRPFQLERGPVMRIRLFTRSPTDHILLLVVHHIAVDVWSLDILMHELRALYVAELNGRRAPLPRAHPQYVDFVRWESEMLAGEEGERLWGYWSQQLSGELARLSLPTDRPRPLVQTYRGASHNFKLSEEVVARLKTLTKAEGGTLFTTILAAFQILLHRYTGREDILVGSPTALRDRQGLEQIVGYLINPVVLRARVAGHMTFKEFFGQVRQTVLAALEHQAYPFSLLIDRLQPTRDASHTPLFQVMFIWDKPRRPAEQRGTPPGAGEPALGADNGQLPIEFFSSGQRGAALDLTLTMFEVGEQLSASVQYNVDLFDASTIARMAGHLRSLLENIVVNPEQRLSALPLLSGAERYQLFREWNDTQKDYPKERCVHQLFESRAGLIPDRVAASFEDEQLTYRGLNRRADRLAHSLRKLGVGPETLVGLCVERSLDMLIGLLGILKAGGAYVPLDPALPRERLSFMLEDARAPVLLTQSHLLENLPEYTGHVVCLDVNRETIGSEGTEDPAPESASDNLAYVIYTSGSTGRPKGVQISHRAVVNFLHSMRLQPGMTGQDVLLAVTSLSFDIAALELLLPLAVGAQVVIAGRDVASDGTKLVKSLESSGASMMQATPVTWRLLLKAGWRGDRNLKILCGGEALPRELANQLSERCAVLWNMYGPTETTIWSAIQQVTPGERGVPIGRPIANTQIYLLDSHMQPVPVGVLGELYVGGEGLGRGYLNRPDLTAVKFVPDPFNNEPGGRLYRTGDLARRLPDGSVDFLQRVDHQLKIRGFRMELGEIEATLDQHPAVQEAVVVAREDQAGEKRLVAYVVARDSHAGGGREQVQFAAERKLATPQNGTGLSVSELRDFLKEKLPEYMVPSAFVVLDAFPLTPNGKVDRRALPAPNVARPTLAEDFVAPRTPVEKILTELWAGALGIEKVGVHDNFFELGGASIQALDIVAKAEDRGLHFAPELLFEYQTVAGLAAAAKVAQTPQAE
jgi:amino acid adenylation domain-containing protein